MKVVVHYSDKQNGDNFQGARLRKNLKNECEGAGIHCADSLASNPDIVHLISAKDELLLNDARFEGSKTVISAFYCEHDTNVSQLSRKFGGYYIAGDKLRFLNSADLVLVPDASVMEFASLAGVTSPMKVHGASVNCKRFEFAEAQAEVFRRYFRILDNDFVVVSFVDYSDSKTLRSLRDLAKSLPEAKIFVYGIKNNLNSLNFQKYRRTAPKNLFIESTVMDDVFRSCLFNAVCYLVLDDVPDSLSLLEAFAAKTQVVVVGEHAFNPFLEDGVTCVCLDSVEEASHYLRRLFLSKESQTIISAYSFALGRSYENQGKELKEIYSELLGG